jgi:exopolyphosphatase/pppGpp-phosphohydrolase
VEQRIKELALRPDRADVIIPALDIYLKVMKWAGVRKIYVPQVGLADGIVHILYEKYKTSQPETSNCENMVKNMQGLPPIKARRLVFEPRLRS